MQNVCQRVNFLKRKIHFNSLSVKVSYTMIRQRYLSAGEVPGEVNHLNVFDGAVYSENLPLFQHTAGHGQVHLNLLRD